jgi:hypothetical protein
MKALLPHPSTGAFNGHEPGQLLSTSWARGSSSLWNRGSIDDSTPGASLDGSPFTLAPVARTPRRATLAPPYNPHS